MKPFQYHEPENVKEACRLFKTYSEDACIIAGGTDLVVKMKRGLIAPKHVINIKRINGLIGIRETDNGFIIGAATPLSMVANHKGIQVKLTILSEAALSIGSAQVRNLATIGGNVCNAAPSADMVPGLLILDTKVAIAGPDGERTIPLAAFFTGPGAVSLDSGELVTKLFIPLPNEGVRMTYIKHGPRKAMDCAVVGIAMGLNIDPINKVCREAKIALGAVAPTPIRAVKTEKQIAGKTISELDRGIIGSLVASEAAPISDLRASSQYRSEMVSTLTLRAIDYLDNAEKEQKNAKAN